jgi:seryl-tRNA synthetase
MPMLNIKDIRKHPDEFQKKLLQKGVPEETVLKLLELDEQKRIVSTQCDALKAEKNKVSKEFPSLPEERKTILLEEMKKISAQVKEKESQLESISKDFNTLMNSLPNIPFDEVPSGGEDDFIVLKEWGEKRIFDFKPKQHWEIGEDLNILDTKRSAKVSGSRFYYLREELAILQMALMNWAFLEIRKLGFSPTIPPFLTRKEAIFGTGYLEKDENYIVNPGKDDLYLIGTSEVPLTSFHADEVLDEDMLPIKFAGYSPCFRREAGSYGKDMKGILRVHQFEKIEMVVLCSPEESKDIHDEMCKVEEKLLQMLQIPYRVILVAAGDLGSSAAKKYDNEAWLPGQNAYQEMTSTSNCTDFQSRRLNIRMRRKNGDIIPLHTLNGTAVSSRPLIAILENFQNADGSVDIPQVLWPFTGGIKKIKRN